MAKARGPTQRRYVREKATIDHLVRMSLRRRRLMRNTLAAAPLLPPACRSRIRFARNGILARVAFPLFTGRDDEPFATSQATAGSRCASKCRRRRRDRHRRLRRSPTRRRSRTTPSSICWTATPARELRAGSVRVPISSSISLWNLIGRRRSRGSSTRLRRQSENAPRKYG